MDPLRNAAAGHVVADLVAVINTNRAYLSEIDGLIGDGDHGINMSKGFTAAGERLKGGSAGLTASFSILGETLLEGVGGSMGPLYGGFFMAMSEALGERELVDGPALSAMLGAGLASVQELGNAKVGDKTLLDTLVPATQAFDAALAAGAPLADCMARMVAAAEKGRDSTKDLVAKVGRASRLGERSRGVLDAGATSCCLILTSIATSLAKPRG